MVSESVARSGGPMEDFNASAHSCCDPRARNASYGSSRASEQITKVFDCKHLAIVLNA